MIESINTAMLELQSALTARSLYPASHPRIRRAERRAYDLLLKTADDTPELTLFAVGERVVFENRTLPSSPHLSESLFRRLHENGVDRISFRSGLVEEELREMLDTLARGDASEPLRPSTHIRLGYIKEADRAAPRAAVVPRSGRTPLQDSEKLSGALSDVWDSVCDGRGGDTDLLGDVVTTVSRMLQHSSSAMLPLANVKRHDEYTFVHTINVSLLSTSLAEAVGFKNRTIHELNMAALLHDVGKQLIPPGLLNKPGKFSDEEFERVQRHPVDGARILLATPGVPELAPIVAYEHHIRADGTGYPRVPKGWKLNLASRVVQVADVFDALRTNRPYRPALPLPKIYQIMKQDEGSMFDPDLLEIFFRDIVSRGVPQAAEISETPAPCLTDG